MLGDILRNARIKKGLKLRELSEKSGYSVSRLSNYEQNRSEPSIEVINHLAEILGIEAGELLKPELAQALDKDEKLIEIIQNQQNCNFLLTQSPVTHKLNLAGLEPLIVDSLMCIGRLAAF